MNRETIIADASCLIVLQNVQELQLLQKLFGKVFITVEIREEFGSDLPDWIKVKQIQNQIQHNALTLVLDKGEASAIALCLENPNSLLIIDERKGRRIAQELGIKIVGTLGVILKAKEKNLIHSVENLLENLESAGFRISSSLKAKILSSEKKRVI